MRTNSYIDDLGEEFECEGRLHVTVLAREHEVQLVLLYVSEMHTLLFLS